MFREFDLKRYDLLIVFLVLLLGIFGIIAIKSATNSNFDETDLYYKKQIIGFVVGLFIVAVISFIDYKFIARFYWVIYFVNLTLLILVLAFGKTVNNATRWIDFGGIGIQPSEFCKIFLIIFLAKLIDKYNEKINNPWFLIAVIGLTIVPVLLILKQPNLSTGLIIMVILASTIFVGGISHKYILGVIIILVPTLIVGFWYIQQPDQKLLQPYQVKRIMTAIYPEEANASDKLQTKNSIQAIGSGKLYGKGLYQGKLNKYNYLPEPQTDFIYSIIGEEFGFAGCSTILGLLLLLILRCIWIAKDAKDRTAKIIILGFAIMLSFQTFVNVGVVTGILPNTGVPLPFISYGLSSLWTNMIGIGLILNISMQRKPLY